MDTSTKPFLDNKYTSWYFAIINQAKLLVNNKKQGYEVHHIIPRCLGGSNSKENLVTLTARQHFVCHLLLTKMHGSHKLGMALQRMMNKGHLSYKPRASRIYDYARRLSSEAKRGANNPMYGKSSAAVCPDFGERVSRGLKNSKAFREYVTSEKHRQQMSDVRSSTVCLVDSNNQVIGKWKNCRELAEHLGCTYANVKTARRQHRPVGKRLNHAEAFVVYEKDLPRYHITNAK
jgi:hypothetical protein